ncbi:hypothetical protein QBC46DRAFT_42372 [Diplogelasinospora grovesii]|uniref:Uncharacterized protein n=1 Tax=Diplogelasinospora grovesii TaxID=303347 RepID=A0AAN6N089_9PEZI|nr:hypothetical protein QBC46DRAFT_42372 [Diplogelasinospora grovesii]
MASAAGQPTIEVGEHPFGERVNTGSDRRGKKRRPPLTRQEYAQAVLSYSQLSVTQSLYAGVHFENLARYLQQPYEARAPDLVARNNDTQKTPTFTFVTLYNLDPAAEERESQINSPDGFESKAAEMANSPHGRLIFMRGHPSPEWLLSIGATYRVDPEFFRRHLDFRQGLRDHYWLPSPPSSLNTALRLRITTIGASVSKARTSSEQDVIEALRELSQSRLSDYREKLKSLAEMKLGDSIMRDFSVHDLEQFTIEQDISLYVGTCGPGWFALIWLDITNNLKDGPATSFFTNPRRTGSWAISSVPVIQHRPGLALRQTPKHRARAREEAQLKDHIPTSSGGGMAQSASLLHLDYGMDLDKTLAGGDSFYALHEVIVFTAFSENQFLNMLETKLLHELDPLLLVRQQEPTLSNLLYNQRVLDRHIQRIRDNLTMFKARESLGWPKMTSAQPGKQRIADEAAEKLIHDYEYLLARALTLSEQCSRGMQVVMNNAMVKESRDAMDQAKGVAKLTRLAFIFVPLSFTASFFGMNFVQFGQGSLDLWIWFAVSTPIFVVSLLSMKYDITGGSTKAARRPAAVSQNTDTRGTEPKTQV